MITEIFQSSQNQEFFDSWLNTLSSIDSQSEDLFVQTEKPEKEEVLIWEDPSFVNPFSPPQAPPPSHCFRPQNQEEFMPDLIRSNFKHATLLANQPQESLEQIQEEEVLKDAESQKFQKEHPILTEHQILMDFENKLDPQNESLSLEEGSLSFQATPKHPSNLISKDTFKSDESFFKDDNDKEFDQDVFKGDSNDLKKSFVSSSQIGLEFESMNSLFLHNGFFTKGEESSRPNKNVAIEQDFFLNGEKNLQIFSPPSQTQRQFSQYLSYQEFEHLDHLNEQAAGIDSRPVESSFENSFVFEKPTSPHFNQSVFASSPQGEDIESERLEGWKPSQAERHEKDVSLNSSSLFSFSHAKESSDLLKTTSIQEEFELPKENLSKDLNEEDPIEITTTVPGERDFLRTLDSANPFEKTNDSLSEDQNQIAPRFKFSKPIDQFDFSSSQKISVTLSAQNKTFTLSVERPQEGQYHLILPKELIEDQSNPSFVPHLLTELKQQGLTIQSWTVAPEFSSSNFFQESSHSPQDEIDSFQNPEEEPSISQNSLSRKKTFAARYGTIEVEV
jgi:hypothetical protein